VLLKECAANQKGLPYTIPRLGSLADDFPM
jgi:hypothetical protein